MKVPSLAACIMLLSPFVAFLPAAGCGGDDTEPALPNLDGGGGSGGQPGDAGDEGTAGTPPDGSAGTAGDAATDTPTDVDPGPVFCPTTFTYRPPSPVGTVMLAGEWHTFDLATASLMTVDGTGTYSATVDLQPGLHAYKLVADGDWRFDPDQGRRKYVGGSENSAIKVRDCRLPTFEVNTYAVDRPSAGAGSFQASLDFVDGIEGTGPDSAGYEATLIHNGTGRDLTGQELAIDPGTGDANVSVGGLSDGKYRIVLRGRTTNGRLGEPVRLVFWVEQESFSWKDALVYMVVTDRFRDGDSTNNPGPTSGSDPRGDWYGGDLQGIRDAIADGTLDRLGVRAIWITPFQTNPVGSYLASDGVHLVTGYHGYWPTRAREVDARIGGEAALRNLVNEAHDHGIRILQDYVVNHVHEDHEYVTSHPNWFRTGCVCGTPGCDWTGHALDCMFTSYMPDIDHTVPEANAQFVDDAVWWLDEYDLDGLRVDAVKHVEEVATRNLAADVRETFEAAGTRYFLMGETAMGWSDCPPPHSCNDENYDTISRYVGPHGLDGQFDFVLYHGVSYRTFAYGDAGFIHADYWVQQSLQRYPAEAIMTPYIGSHDTSRFTSLADYRGQDAAHDRGIPGNQWNNTAVEPNPGDNEPYERTRIAMAWLLGLPGAPLLYYGDEYGQWGGADPNNRLMWKPESALNASETATLDFVRKAGTARKNLVALRRGEYVPLSATENTLVYGRRLGGDAAIVAITRNATPEIVTTDVATPLGWSSGTLLHDHMGGPDVTVTGGGTIAVTVPAKGAAVLAP